MDKKKTLRTIITLAALAAVLFLYLRFVGCAMYTFVGIPCPGCGMTRACNALLHLDFAAAWQYHPLCFLTPPVALIILFRKKRFFRVLYKSPFFWGALLALMLAVYGMRMFTMFPNTEPMTFNKEALIIKYILKGLGF